MSRSHLVMGETLDATGSSDSMFLVELLDLEEKMLH
jgi:hypothetical protein